MSRWVVLLLIAGCRVPGSVDLGASDVAFEPDVLTFADTWVGTAQDATLTLTHRGGANVDWEVQSPGAPFEVVETRVRLARGEVATVTVRFVPTSGGTFEGVLRVGTRDVALHGVGLEIPECRAEACHEASFDVIGGQCVSVTSADGVACQTTCVTGQCLGGQCTGMARDCGDGDACTIDACGANGCTHAPVVCPAPTNPCEVATCDASSGCGVVPVDDGVLCGADDCIATQVNVCISGQCVPRTRPNSARCTNRWVPTAIPGRGYPSMAFDGTRGRVVLFGSEDFADTWELFGARWSLLSPAASPPPMEGGMTWDEGRRRVVLVGQPAGATTLETWEWDGTTWLRRSPLVSPPARVRPIVAYDPLRRVTVFLGTFDAVARNDAGMLEPRLDTWEWNGSAWRSVPSAQVPVTASFMRPSMAFDANRGRVVMATTDAQRTFSFWEFDGTQWLEVRLPGAPQFIGTIPNIAFDAARARLVLRGGFSSVMPRLTWESDGLTWTASIDTIVRDTTAESIVYDPVRGRVVAYDGNSTRLQEWDGSTWSQLSQEPKFQSGPSTWNPVAQRVLRYDGQTWEFDGRVWARLTPVMEPSGRWGAALTWDVARQRAVLFGGADDTGHLFDETWEWDGSNWQQRTPAVHPPAGTQFTMTWNSARSRVVLVEPSARWEWDGTTWTPTGMGASVGSWLSFDERHSQLVLSTGQSLFLENGMTWASGGLMPAPLLAANELGMTWDPVRERVLAVGVRTLSTWEWDGSSWTQRMVEPTTASGQATLVYDTARSRPTLCSTSGTWVLLP